MDRTQITRREFGRRPSWVLAAVRAGEPVTVTENGAAVAHVVPTGAGAPPHPTDPMGEIGLPDLGLPDLGPRDRLRELVSWLEEQHGPVTEAERDAARAELDELDAGHERRRRAREARG
ncbi:type II toxin-antitoxin system prevent-host-death family antitoxin [Streptomyces sp. NPDC086147]|uniref:type II toxin-antitoxin system Phd/YefM family antitoxin n=1 Tax=Streptomyces sp. NPDC086147 TaxID=3155295 RepID=UPI00344D9E59